MVVVCQWSTCFEVRRRRVEASCNDDPVGSSYAPATIWQSHEDALYLRGWCLSLTSLSSMVRLSMAVDRNSDSKHSSNLPSVPISLNQSSPSVASCLQLCLVAVLFLSITITFVLFL